MTFSLLMKYLKNQKSGNRSNLKRFESEKKIRYYVDKYKIARKNKRKSFYGRSKNISVKSNSSPTNSTPSAFYLGQVQSTTPHI